MPEASPAVAGVGKKTVRLRGVEKTVSFSSLPALEHQFLFLRNRRVSDPHVESLGANTGTDGKHQSTLSYRILPGGVWRST